MFPRKVHRFEKAIKELSQSAKSVVMRFLAIQLSTLSISVCMSQSPVYMTETSDVEQRLEAENPRLYQHIRWIPTRKLREPIQQQTIESSIQYVTTSHNVPTR